MQNMSLVDTVLKNKLGYPGFEPTAKIKNLDYCIFIALHGRRRRRFRPRGQYPHTAVLVLNSMYTRADYPVL